MLVVGLLGGVASGKSLVAGELVALGAALLDGDRAGHEVLRMPDVERAVRERWGARVFGQDGRIDRSALARIVFASPSEPTAQAHPDASGGRTTPPVGNEDLNQLEQITHPRIGALLERRAAELEADGYPVAVLDAPVMLKAGWDHFCDRIVFIEAPLEVRLARARQRGWTPNEFAEREAAQESLNVKRDHADTIIDNSGSPEATRAQVTRLWQSLVG